MRVYEFSKQCDIPVKSLLDALHEGGFVVKSHMSVINEDMKTYLKNRFGEKLIEQPAKLASKHEKKPSSHVAKEPKELKETVEKKLPVFKKAVAQEKKVVKKNDPASIQGFVIAPMNVGDFSLKTHIPVSDVILVLLRMGIMVNKNQLLKEDIVAVLTKHYGIKAEEPVATKDHFTRHQATQGATLKSRLPVVVVLGHVDHGKTTLLDYIRKTRVAAKEKGGITQHLGAYEAVTPQGNIVFLDTPGHEAFPKMRKRGVRVADVVILVVAADDGIMPQTVEAIKQAQAMHVPIIIAVNKIDKVDLSRVDIVKQQLSQHGLLVEDWGGEVICIPISAKTGAGIEQLLEMVALQSQILELRADYSGHAKGYLLEARLEKGYGPVATLICQQGTINVGDFFVCGNTVGKVSVLVNSAGKKIQNAAPSIPVQVVGFESLPEAGDFFEIVDKNTYLEKRSNLRDHIKTGSIGFGSQQEGAVNLILKVDANSTQEAVLDAAVRLTTKKDSKGLNIIHAAVGSVSESDVELAYNTGSIIVGLHVKSESNASLLAQGRGVAIRLFDIIYKLLEYLEEIAKKPVLVEYERIKVGQANVLRVFDIKNVGVIAGCYVIDGRFVQSGIAVIKRGKQKIGEGKIMSLQREKKSVKEVHAGFECGFIVEKFREWEVDDTVECYIEQPKK